MNASPLAHPEQPAVSIHDGQVTTTSKALADYFGKQHRNVIQKIEALKVDCPPEWYALNFQRIQISVDLGLDRTRQDPAYELTRDGFVLLAMGFTGKRALAFKLAYIDAFNRMEAELHQRGVVALTADDAYHLNALLGMLESFRPDVQRAEKVFRMTQSPLAPRLYDAWCNVGWFAGSLASVRKRCAQVEYFLPIPA